MHVTGNCHYTDCQVQGSAPYRFGALIHSDSFCMQGTTRI